MEQGKNRVVYFDYLRVFATLAVIFLHVASQNWLPTSVKSVEWSVFNIYDSLVRWGVPCFVMISGALFLPRNIETKQIYKKYIFRMVCAYLFWSVFYAAFFPVLKLLFVKGYDFPVRSVLEASLRGHVHLWFIPMIAGMYMCIPLLKPIVQKPKNARYFLILFLIFASVLPQLSNLAKYFGGEYTSLLMDCINTIVGNMGVNMVMGYAGYFVLGYYLNTIEMKASCRAVVYLLGIIGTLATIFLSAKASFRVGAPVEAFYKNLNVNVLLQSIAVFTLCKYGLRNGIPGCGKLVSVLSKCSFGAYLVHMFILAVLKMLGFDSLSFHPALSVPAISFIVAVASFTISYILNHIPFLNKFII